MTGTRVVTQCRLVWVAGLLSPIAFSALVVAAAAIAFVDDPEAAISHAFSYFAMPVWIAGAGMFALTTAVRRRWRQRAGMVRVIASTLGLLCIAALLWLLAMHAGTWLEWQERRTPIAFGTEWFYAEVYSEYVRRPRGLVITLSAALAVVLPALLWLVPSPRDGAGDKGAAGGRSR